MEHEGENNYTNVGTKGLCTSCWCWFSRPEKWDQLKPVTWIPEKRIGPSWNLAGMSCCSFLSWSTLIFVPPLFPHKESLNPHQVSANSEGTDHIVVTWQHPRKADLAVQEYIVEWWALHPEGSTQPLLNWLRLPANNVSSLISGM
jgi:hypothetical protein